MASPWNWRKQPESEKYKPAECDCSDCEAERRYAARYGAELRIPIKRSDRSGFASGNSHLSLSTSPQTFDSQYLSSLWERMFFPSPVSDEELDRAEYSANKQSANADAQLSRLLRLQADKLERERAAELAEEQARKAEEEAEQREEDEALLKRAKNLNDAERLKRLLQIVDPDAEVYLGS